MEIYNNLHRFIIELYFNQLSTINEIRIHHSFHYRNVYRWVDMLKAKGIIDTMRKHNMIIFKFTKKGIRLFNAISELEKTYKELI